MDIRRFLAELKGRGVYRVAALYAAGSWALLQVADIFFPLLGFPDWAITSVLAAAALGFPIAVILAWLFDITPQGIVETDTVTANYGRLRLSPARVIELGLLMALVFLVGFLYLDRLSLIGQVEKQNKVSQVASQSSIAVMPFVNMSDSAELEYFGDGLAEEILNLLARLNELDVAARTSSFYFKNRDADIQEIANHLGVRHVLEGSVRLQGNKVRVTAQLIDASNGFHLWSETYDRDLGQTFSIQDEIAQEVADALQSNPSEKSSEILAQRPSLDPQAYDYYLRALDYLRKSSSTKSLEAAVTLFSKATMLDENYAEAHAGLCETYLERYSQSVAVVDFTAAQNACQRALSLDSKALAVYLALGNLYRYSGEYDEAMSEFNKALALAPKSVEAYIGLGETYREDGKPRQAEEMFSRAIELQPNYWRSYMAMGTYFFVAGRYEEAIPYYSRITELMPDNAMAFNNLGGAYYMLGQFEQAATAMRRSLALEPTSLAYSNAGSSLYFLGRFEDAADMFQKSVELAPDDFQNWGNLGDAYRHAEQLSDLAEPMYRNAIKLAREQLEVNSSDIIILTLIGHYYAAIGEREQALQYSARANALGSQDVLVNYNTAVTMCSLNELEAALDALERAVELGYSRDLIGVDANLKPLRAAPRFAELLVKDENN